MPLPSSDSVTARDSSPTPHSIGWADDPTCPDYYVADHMVAHLFSCPTHPTDLAPGDMCSSTPPVALLSFPSGSSVPGGSPAVCRSALTSDWLRLFPFLTLIPAVRLPLSSSGLPAWPLRLQVPPSPPLPHLIQCCGGQPPPLRHPASTTSVGIIWDLYSYMRTLFSFPYSIILFVI